MRQPDDHRALHTQATAEAEALVTRVEAEIGRFVETLTSQIGGHPDIETLQQQLSERDAENERLKTLLVKARMDLEAAKADLAAERETNDAGREEMARVTTIFERTMDEIRRDHAAVLAEQAAACTTLPLDELLTVFHLMAGASTSQELLRTLQSGLAREFSRVALFHIDGARLVAAERRGFSGEDTARPIHLAPDSLLTRAVSTCQFESLLLGQDGPSIADLPFGGTPGCALALPIVEDGAMAGLIYADDSDHVEFASNVPQARIKFAELVYHYAVLLMLRISVEAARRSDPARSRNVVAISRSR